MGLGVYRPFFCFLIIRAVSLCLCLFYLFRYLIVVALISLDKNLPCFSSVGDKAAGLPEQADKRNGEILSKRSLIISFYLEKKQKKPLEESKTRKEKKKENSLEGFLFRGYTEIFRYSKKKTSN